MAGKLKMPTMESPLFSLNAVDRKTLANWRARIDTVDLQHKMQVMMGQLDPLVIEYNDSRQLGNLVETLQEIHGLYHNLQLTAILSTNISVNVFVQFGIYDVTVMRVAEGKEKVGLAYLLLANTYRAMHQELTGPIPGFNFNITIAGIVALCMKLDVSVNFDS